MLFGEDAAAAVVVVVRSQERTSDFFATESLLRTLRSAKHQVFLLVVGARDGQRQAGSREGTDCVGG